MKRHRDTSPGPATSAIGHSRSSRPVHREGHHHQTNFVDTKPCRPPLCACPAAAVSHAADHYQAPAEAMWYQQPQGYWVQPAGPACQQQQLVAWPWLQPSTWHYAPVPPPPPFWSPYSWPAPPPPPSSWYYCGHAAAAAASAAAAAAPPATFWPPPPTCCMDQAAPPLDTTCCCQQCYPSPTTHCFHQPAGCMEPQEEWTSKSKHKHAAAHQQPRGADGDDDDALVKREAAEDSFFTMLPLRGR